MGYLAPFSSLVGVSLIWDGLFVTICFCMACVHTSLSYEMDVLRRNPACAWKCQQEEE